MNHEYILLGDNLHEAMSVAENIVKHIGPKSPLKKISDVKLTGCPAQPVYSFSYGKARVTITCLGNYELWIDQFPEIKKYIKYFDHPDAVLYSVNLRKVVAAGEFTDTVSVGNSQWQRAQRFVAAAILQIPFLGVYVFGEDRSQKTLRESSALLTYSYLKIGIDSGIPLFLIFKDSLYLNCHNKARKKNGLDPLSFPDGAEITGKWFGLRLLNSIGAISDLSIFEAHLQQEMFKNLYYTVKNRGKDILLVDKDLPAYHALLPKKTVSAADIRKVSFKDLCQYPWTISGKDINRSFFKRVVYPEIKDFFKTYKVGGKFAIADKKYSARIESILHKHYPPSSLQPWGIGLIDQNKPIVMIPLQVWKKMKKDGKTIYGFNDPNGGEAVLFPTLLDSLRFNSTANIIYVYYGSNPDDWHPRLNKSNQKIYRATNTIGKLLCADSNGGRPNPKSYSIKRRTL